MTNFINLPNFTEEKALTHIIAFLRSGKAAMRSGYGNETLSAKTFSIKDVTEDSINAEARSRNLGSHYTVPKNAETFYCVLSDLCARSILVYVPTFRTMALGEMFALYSTDFRLTEYGLKWLVGNQTVKFLPSEYGRFKQSLGQHKGRFGEGYLSRSIEAVNCYEAHTYYACCVMCGAAAKSILLALAVAKAGPDKEAQVLKDYSNGAGTSKTLKIMQMENHVGAIKDNFDTLMGLISRWRNASAHGLSINVNENTAFISLLTLLNFAQFADDSWDTLTTVKAV